MERVNGLEKYMEQKDEQIRQLNEKSEKKIILVFQRRFLIIFEQISHQNRTF